MRITGLEVRKNLETSWRIAGKQSSVSIDFDQLVDRQSRHRQSTRLASRDASIFVTTRKFVLVDERFPSVLLAIFLSHLQVIILFALPLGLLSAYVAIDGAIDSVHEASKVTVLTEYPDGRRTWTPYEDETLWGELSRAVAAASVTKRWLVVVLLIVFVSGMMALFSAAIVFLSGPGWAIWRGLLRSSVADSNDSIVVATQIDASGKDVWIHHAMSYTVKKSGVVGDLMGETTTFTHKQPMTKSVSCSATSTHGLKGAG